MEYARILKRAAHVTWKYRALWLFGFLLALFGGGAGGSYGRGANWNMDRTDLNRPEWVLGLVLLVVFAVLVMVVLVVVLNGVSRGALIGMVREIEESGTTSVRSGWKVGMSRLFSMIGIDLLTGIPAAIVATLLLLLGAAPLLLMLVGRGSPGDGEPLAVLAILFTILLELGVIALLIAGGVVLSLVVELAYRRCVLAGDGAARAIGTAWRTLRANLGRVGGMWLILLLLDLLAGALMIPLYLLLFGAAGGLGMVVYRSLESAAPAVLAGALVFIPGLVVVSFVSGIYQAFRSAFWTLGYRELAPVSTANT
jgi:hypothetical protein